MSRRPSRVHIITGFNAEPANDGTGTASTGVGRVSARRRPSLPAIEGADHESTLVVPQPRSRRPSLSAVSTHSGERQEPQERSRRPSFASVAGGGRRPSFSASGGKRPSFGHRLSKGRLSTGRLSVTSVGIDDAATDVTLQDLIEDNELEDEEEMMLQMDAPRLSPANTLIAGTGVHLAFRRAQLQLAEVSPKAGESPKDEARVAKALARLPLLAGCGPILPQRISRKAGFDQLEDGEELDFTDGTPLYIVKSGTLQISLGRGVPPKYLAGPGTVLNFAGLLSLGEAGAPFEPGRTARPAETLDTMRMARKDDEEEQSPYELGPEKGGEQLVQPPRLYTENSRKGGVQPPVASKGVAQLTDDLRCFYNLCPHATLENIRVRRTGWIPYKAVGVAPVQGTGPIVATVELSLLEELAAEADADTGADGDRFHLATSAAISIGRGEKLYANIDRIKVIWRIILARGASVFPGVPPEVIWAVAEVSTLRHYAPGQRIVTEADPAPNGENIILIDTGVAIVEKLMGVSNVKTKQVTLGRLYAGAIIGDLCSLGAGTPRPASARAESEVTAVIMPSHNLLTVLKRFPGMLSGTEGHLKQVVAFLQLRLPPRNDVISTSSLFAGCDPAFINEVAGAGERIALTCGQLVQDVNDRSAYAKDSAVYIMEHGRCVIDTLDNRGHHVQYNVLPGACFGVGEPAMVGCAEVRMSAVRVVTPFALTLTIPKRAITSSSSRYYGQERLLASSSITPEDRKLGLSIQSHRVFQASTRAFLLALSSLIRTTCYMSGQTICVQGAQDASQMFVLKSGKVVVEREGARIAELPPGAVFGELMMLGAVRRRTATIRAATFCTLLELPRKGFMEAIDRFPEERQRFEELALRYMTPGLTITWPIAEDMPPRLVLLLNMKATRRICPAEDPTFQETAARGSAVLLLQGDVAVMDPSDPEEVKEVKTLTAGECWNEQILLGIPNAKGEYLLPKTACEVQVMSDEVFRKCMTEFRSEEAIVKRSIYKYMLRQAEIKAGAKPNSTTLLQNSALFRGVSSEFTQAVRDALDPIVFAPGETIITEGQDGQKMYVLAEGKASTDRGLSRFDCLAGQVFGGAAMLGSMRQYQKTVVAETMCVCMGLDRRTFLKVLSNYPSQSMYYEVLTATPFTGKTLKDVMLAALRAADSVFSQCDAAFVTTFGMCFDSSYFAPGETIITRGAPCSIGETPFFILLSGEAQVEGEHGMLMEVVKPGAIIGEGGALGLHRTRGATVRVKPGKPSWCGIIHGAAAKAALQSFPDELKVFMAIHSKRQQKNAALLDRRRAWIEEVALPALRSSDLFTSCDSEFLATLAAPLPQITVETGAPLVIVGEKTDYMLIITDGKAVMEDRSGSQICTLTKGAVIGEVAMLGLFDVHVATVKALIQCQVLKVRTENFQYALSHWTEDEERASANRQKFDELIGQRLWQVAQALPLSAVRVSGIAMPELEETSAKTVALQTHRLVIEAGEILRPLPDSGPRGSCFCIVAKGKLSIEIAPDYELLKRVEIPAQRDILVLGPGDLYLEGVIAEKYACARACCPCELYRVRHCDLTVAMTSAPPAAEEWWARFQLHMASVQKLTCERLAKVHSMLSSLIPHPFDKTIHEWKINRVSRLQRATITRKERALCMEGDWRMLEAADFWEQLKPKDEEAPGSPARTEIGSKAAKENGKSPSKSPAAAAGSPPRCRSAPSVGRQPATCSPGKSWGGTSPGIGASGRPTSTKSAGRARHRNLCIGLNAASTLPGLSICDGKVWEVFCEDGKPVARVAARPFSAILRRHHQVKVREPEDAKRGSIAHSSSSSSVA